MNLSEVNWDYNAAGSWPIEVKIIVVLLICLLLTGGGIYQFTLPQLTAWDVLEKEEQELRADFREKQKRAVNLPEYKKQFKQIEALLDKMLKQMPSQAEVSVLLRKVSKKAKESGLQFNYMKKQETVKQEFYVELPNKLEVLGNYHDLGLFVSSLSTLDRIVTVHEVVISRLEKRDKEEDDRLEMKAIITTYNEVLQEDDESSGVEAVSE